MITLAPLIPPFRFASVEHDLYRGSYPSLKNLRFLTRLNLTSIISLTPDKTPTQDLLEFCTHTHTKSYHFVVPKYDESLGVVVSHQTAAKIVSLIIKKENLPCYLHCRDGGNNTGLIVMCLRRLQHWSLSMIYDEFCRYVKSGEISRDECQFVESFKAEIEVSERIPGWLWQGVPVRAHPSLKIKLLASASTTHPVAHTSASDMNLGAEHFDGDHNQLVPRIGMGIDEKDREKDPNGNVGGSMWAMTTPMDTMVLGTVDAIPSTIPRRYPSLDHSASTGVIQGSSYSTITAMASTSNSISGLAANANPGVGDRASTGSIGLIVHSHIYGIGTHGHGHGHGLGVPHVASMSAVNTASVPMGHFTGSASMATAVGGGSDSSLAQSGASTATGMGTLPPGYDRASRSPLNKGSVSGDDRSSPRTPAMGNQLVNPRLSDKAITTSVSVSASASAVAAAAVASILSPKPPAGPWSVATQQQQVQQTQGQGVSPMLHGTLGHLGSVPAIPGTTSILALASAAGTTTTTTTTTTATRSDRDRKWKELMEKFSFEPGFSHSASPLRMSDDVTALNLNIPSGVVLTPSVRDTPRGMRISNELDGLALEGIDRMKGKKKAGPR
eukprot:CAMPEP_0184695792 /NCGR_PEP_ID=MMETSP0313-20130426/3319_1 /TAXON_ID=2792 /ORGANISM="Porphyridium aerugineum, Strain SAG 1380-2" /LENGTH=612 /DNA_ID=CAMNT_0027154317 /DNA_START=98 /DNA_END=1936 /DNA_ORIENTATION=+